MQRAGLVLLLAVGCAAIGCTAVESPPAAAGLTLAPRPREVRIDGVEPCALLTDRQRGELRLEPRADPFVDRSALYRGAVPSCLLWGASPRPTRIGLGVVTTAGVELFTGGKLDAELRALTVQGFPAVVAAPRGATDYCSVEIDVAPGQLVDVLYGDVALPPPIPQDELCAGAERVADAVMTTLLTR